MPRPRKRAAVLLIGAGVLFFVGANVQAGWLFVLAAFLVGTVLAGILLPGRMLRRLRIERRVPEEVHQHDEVLVDLAVTNTSRGMRLGVLIEDGHLDDTRVFVPSLKPGQTAEVTTSRRARRRGPIQTDRITLRTVAPFGVAERRRRTAVAGTTLVLPVVVPLGSLSFVEPAATLDRAIHPAPRVGHGPEYLGVREYRPGDSMRHVHWPSTARTGTVMVRDFEEETTRRLAILVDTSQDAGDAWTPLDRCCCAVASIALAAASQGQGARLVLATGDGVEVVARAEGRELLRHLAMVEPGGPPFAQVIDDTTFRLRGVETAVLVLPTWRANEPSTLVPAVAALASRVRTVLALLVDVTDAEERSRALERAAVGDLVRGLHAAGAQVRIWAADADLDATLIDMAGVMPTRNREGVRP
ncbi:MAG: DUF58 domain-containing protein [Actinomycetota bacterium]|nr:DUF58 domain-containing protein [Actinomycetota bacterium]